MIKTPAPPAAGGLAEPAHPPSTPWGRGGRSESLKRRLFFRRGFRHRIAAGQSRRRTMERVHCSVRNHSPYPDQNRASSTRTRHEVNENAERRGFRGGAARG